MAQLIVASTPAEAYALLTGLVARAGIHGLLPLRSVLVEVAYMGPDVLVVENGLFDREALESYTDVNLGRTLHYRDGTWRRLRGGDQGYYAPHMREKVGAVLEALRSRPGTKRAVLTIPSFSNGSKAQRAKCEPLDDAAKCMRELHFYVEGGALHCTGYMRAQALEIWPKNAHMTGSLMAVVAGGLGLRVGSYTCLVTTMVADRSG